MALRGQGRDGENTSQLHSRNAELDHWGQRQQRRDYLQGKRDEAGKGGRLLARPCDSLHTQVHRNNSRFPWITAGIVWHWGRNQRGKGKTSSFANIGVTVCSGCRASPPLATLSCLDNSRTFIKKTSLPSTVPHRWAMWVLISFLWSHMGFPPSLHLILYGFSKSISCLKWFCLQKAYLYPHLFSLLSLPVPFRKEFSVAQ